MKNYIADGNFGPVEQPAAAAQYDEPAEADSSWRGSLRASFYTQPELIAVAAQDIAASRAEDQWFRNWVHKTEDNEPDYSCQGTGTSDPITRKGMLANQDYKALGLHKFSLEVNADKLPDVAGWQPPLMYDVTTDTKRLVTQVDVDRWEYAMQCFSTIRQKFHDIERIYEDFFHQVNSSKK